MSEANSLFHERLVAERVRHNLTQGELRRCVAVGKTTQVNYESGETSPDARYLLALHEIGFDIPYLLTGRRSLTALSADEQALLAAFNTAPPILRCAALAVLRCADD